MLLVCGWLKNETLQQLANTGKTSHDNETVRIEIFNCYSYYPELETGC